jgi:hypothetical protein
MGMEMEKVVKAKAYLTVWFVLLYVLGIEELEMWHIVLEPSLVQILQSWDLSRTDSDN